MGSKTDSLRWLLLATRGPLFTVAVVIVIALIDRYFQAIPNPPAFLLLTLVISAYVGGVLSGLISAVLTWLYTAVFFSTAGRPFHYADDNLRRVVVWAITMPAMALLVGTLKSRTLRQLSEIKESEVRLRSVLDNIVDAVFTFDESGVIESFNPASERLFGYPAAEAIGRDVASLFAVEREPTGGAADKSLAKRPPLGLSTLPVNGREMLCRHQDGAEFPVEIDVTEMPFRGKMLFIGTARDLRERKRVVEDQRRSEEERNRLQEELIRAQASALAELSTPLIPVRSQVLVMPLVGTMDSQRAASVIEVLLSGINEHRAHGAIIDVTGVPVVDTAVAGALIRAANAARMLGARVVITGIRPEVAQTLVTLGADLRGITTCRTLEQGIAFVEAQSEAKRALRR